MNGRLTFDLLNGSQLPEDAYELDFDPDFLKFLLSGTSTLTTKFKGPTQNEATQLSSRPTRVLLSACVLACLANALLGLLIDLNMQQEFDDFAVASLKDFPRLDKVSSEQERRSFPSSKK